VEAGPTVRPAPLSERLEDAARLARTGDVVLVVWMEWSAPPSSDPIDVVVYAVGRNPERALVEVARLPRIDRPEDHRALALKVANLLDLVLAEGRTAPALLGTPQVAPPESRETPTRSSFSMEIGGVGASPGGDVDHQGGLHVGVGTSVARGHWRVGPYLAARWMSDLEATNAVGELRLDEIDAGVGGRLLARRGRFAGGFGAELCGRFIRAHARSSSGRTDARVRVVPALRAGVEGRLALAEHADTLQLRLFAGAELSLVRQRFSILELPAAALGRARAVGEIALVVSVP
jgi:hypothetical protein